MANVKKKLTKSETNKRIAGVAGGIADYLGVDATVVRLLFVIFAIAGGPGLIVYFIMALVMSPPGTKVGELLTESMDNASVSFGKAAEVVSEAIEQEKVNKQA